LVISAFEIHSESLKDFKSGEQESEYYASEVSYEDFHMAERKGFLAVPKDSHLGKL
jgi:hypothetical protein